MPNGQVEARKISEFAQKKTNCQTRKNFDRIPIYCLHISVISQEVHFNPLVHFH